MAQKKKLNDLTIKDNFMFGAVMTEEKNCRALLELILEFPIERVEVSKEKNIVYHPEYKGIRLDIYARDENNTRYNVEMQVAKTAALGKRSRYYQSQIDMEMLLNGSDYRELPNSYVIFICDFDPFQKKKYRYTFTRQCTEDPEVDLCEGTTSIFLSTAGRNDDEVPKELVSFLKYLKADQNESEADFKDDFVKNLQNSVKRVKSNREMEERFMIFEEMLREERAEGRAEGIAEGKAEGRVEGIVEGLIQCISSFLEKKGELPEELRHKLTEEKDLKILNQWVHLSAEVDSVDEFIKKSNLF